MRLLFFSDLHVHTWSEFGTEARLEDCVSVLSDVREYAKQHDISVVIFGGDMFHKKGVVMTRPYVRVAEELAAFRNANIEFYSLDGNHDHEAKDGSVHALQPLAEGGLLEGIPRKGWRNISFDRDGAYVCLFSYCDSVELMAERVADACGKRKKQLADWGEPDVTRVGVFHHGFKGAKVGTSLEYEVNEPLDPRELKLDKRFDIVFSGHYHMHQPIAGISNGWYIGSPLEHTRSDIEDMMDTEKGFIVLDTKTKKWELVPLKRPRFMRLMVGRDKALRKIVEGNFIDVQYEKPGNELDAYIEKCRELGARGVNPVPLPRKEDDGDEERRLNVDPTVDPVTVLKRYLKFKKDDIKAQELDSAELLVMGKELLAKAEAKL